MTRGGAQEAGAARILPRQSLQLSCRVKISPSLQEHTHGATCGAWDLNGSLAVVLYNVFECLMDRASL